MRPILPQHGNAIHFRQKYRITEAMNNVQSCVKSLQFSRPLIHSISDSTRNRKRLCRMAYIEVAFVAELA